MKKELYRTIHCTDFPHNIFHELLGDCMILIQNKKVSYRRGTARRAILVSSCYVSRGMGVRKVSISKSDLQGHSRALALVPFDGPHSLTLQLCLYLAPFPRYYHLFRNTSLMGVIYYACTSTPVYQSAHEI